MAAFRSLKACSCSFNYSNFVFTFSSFLSGSHQLEKLLMQLMYLDRYM